MSSFAERLVGHLNDRQRRYQGMGCYTESQIKDIDVQWYEGEDTTDDWGDPRLRLPTLEVIVTMYDNERIQADPGWCLEQMMRQALGLELNP
jgi:hypothetical protein